MTKSAKPLPPSKRRILSLKQSKLPHFRVGHLGEEIAERFLIKKGYQVLDRNMVFKQCELDLVALDQNHQEIVFVEVKTRQSESFGHPSEAVTPKKLRSVRQAAKAYLASKGLRNCYRFDIISVTPAGVEHFENVTWP